MTERISLVEQYNNKDVIVQVKRALDQTAEAVTVSTEARNTAAASATEAHTASQNANAASTQAQTAAATVATYGTRLQNVEDQSAGNRSDIQTIDGEITDIYNDLTNVVRKVGDAGQIVMNGLDLRGTNSVPNTTIGQRDASPANGKRIVDELSAYTPMMRTTGNQTVDGLKTFNEGLYGVNSVANIAATQPNRWIGITYKGNTTQFCKFDFCNYINSGTSVYIEGVMFWNGGSQGVFVKAYGYTTGLSDRMKWTVDSGDNFTVWMRAEAYHTVMANVVQSRSWTNTMIPSIVYIDNPNFNSYAKSGNVTIQ